MVLREWFATLAFVAIRQPYMHFICIFLTSAVIGLRSQCSQRSALQADERMKN